LQFDVEHDSANIACKFFGKDILVGNRRSEIMLYDLFSDKVAVRLKDAHDIKTLNSVAPVDGDPNLIVSGGDDMIIKVWDARNMGTNKQVGNFIGH
jgi:WD40 repeat protein